MRIAALSCLLLLIATTATAEPIATGAIQVIDGDTISARGQTVRLVGLDTPEGGIMRCVMLSEPLRPGRRTNCGSSLPAVA